MCEICVIDPEQSTIQMMQQLAAVFNQEQGDGLGVLAVFDTGDSFEYRNYKSTDPHWASLFSFLRDNWSDAWRFVLHGRAATAGEVNRQNTHPVPSDCDMCDFDWVVHNGSVRNHRNIRPQLVQDGHEINTPVDSEIIAHKVSELPETVEDHNRRTYDFRGNLNYLLFSEDGIFVRVSDKYALDDDFTMTCRASELDGFDEDTSTEWMLISPGGEMETKERTSRSYTSSAGYRGTTQTGWGGRAQQNFPSDEESSSSDSDGDKYTIRYPDLASGIDGLTVLKVAPGVLRLINKQDSNESFIKRQEYPKVYYHWVEEDAPDNLEEMARAAKRLREDSEQTSVEDFSDSDATAEVVEEEDGGFEDALGDEIDRSWAEEVAEEQGMEVQEVANIGIGIRNLVEG